VEDKEPVNFPNSAD